MGVIPEIGRLGYLFCFLDLFQFQVNVKGASSAPARASPDPLPVLK
jgi:hypothetical protein